MRQIILACGLVGLFILGFKFNFNLDGITQNTMVIAALILLTEWLDKNGAIIYVKYRPNRYYWQFGAKNDVF